MPPLYDNSKSGSQHTAAIALASNLHKARLLARKEASNDRPHPTHLLRRPQTPIPNPEFAPLETRGYDGQKTTKGAFYPLKQPHYPDGLPEKLRKNVQKVTRNDSAISLNPLVLRELRVLGGLNKYVIRPGVGRNRPLVAGFSRQRRWMAWAIGAELEHGMFRHLAILAVMLVLVASARAADWPQWRGPARNGIAPASPALLEEFPKEGPKKLWASEAIPGGGTGGYGSCAVAGGKVYLYVNRSYESPRRILTAAALEAAGYAPDMSAALSQLVEAARTSPARAEIKDTKILDPWVAKWMREEFLPKDPDAKKFASAAQARLRAGADAIPLDVLAKLKPIIGQTYDTPALLDAWLKTAGIADKVAKQVNRMMVPPDMESEDMVYCLDAATGKTLWKTPIGSQWYWFACSCTPTIAGGKCYVWNSQGRVYCLDAKDGKELWKSEACGPATFHHNRSSCVLLIGGMAVVNAENGLHAVNAQDGKLAWSLKQYPSPQGSAMAWAKDGKDYILVNAGEKLACLDPKDGAAKWSVKSGPSAAPPSTDGDFAALCTSEPGLIGYTIGADGAKEAWKQPFKDTHAGVILKDGYVYAVGCAYQEPGKGRAVCIEQKSGTVAWEQTLGPAQLSTPLLADGKIIAVNGSELVVFKASPEKFTLIGKADLGLERWSSPAIADGKAFLRTGAGVVCYDLRKQHD